MRERRTKSRTRKRTEAFGRMSGKQRMEEIISKSSVSMVLLCGSIHLTLPCTFTEKYL